MATETTFKGAAYPVEETNNAKTPSMKRNTRAKKIVGQTALYFFTIIISVTFFLPFVFMVYGSLQATSDTVTSWPLVAPSFRNFGNYVKAMEVMDFFNALGNTLFILCTSTVLQISSSVLVAYGFARFKNKYTEPFFMLLLSTMMLPWIVTMVPSYVIYAELGFISSSSVFVRKLPLILPAISGSAFNIYMLRNYMRGIPQAIDEAAEIDGCSSFGILIKILVPNMTPILTTMLIFAVTGSWSDYVGPSIYLNDKELFTLALSIGNFAGSTSSVEKQLQMAGCTLYTLPLLILLFTAQKAFMKGIVTTSVKG
ncbi:MAG: carbohydrate ABC transporter permease [Clostridia bacterium]|nr:carbohydrate ABC transporter permease [Clostridia bacterium]